MALPRPQPKAPFSLEEVVHLDPTYINELLTSNNYHPQSPLINRLVATILLHNGSLLRPEDNKYINEAFNVLYLYDNHISG